MRPLGFVGFALFVSTFACGRQPLPEDGREGRPDSGAAGGTIGSWDAGAWGGSTESWDGNSGDATSAAAMFCKETGHSCQGTGITISICCTDSQCKLVMGGQQYPCPRANCDSLLLDLLSMCGDGPGIGTPVTGGAGGTSATIAGTGGVSSIGTPSSGGATSATGSSNPKTDGVLCPLPDAPLIADFDTAPSGGGGIDPTQPQFGMAGTLKGGGYSYPGSTSTYPLLSDMTKGNWRMSGTVGDYSGFGLYWDGCSRVDASAYRGIAFTISGSLPQGQTLTMGVSTLNNIISADWLLAHQDPNAKPGDPGRCVPPASVTNRYVQTTCRDAERNIPVTATPTTVKVLWGDFSKGAPVPYVEPSDIVMVYWYLSWAGIGTATYPVDITLDDLSFVP